MKTLNEFLNKTSIELIIESCLEVDENSSLETVYENLYNKIINEEGQINEGFFSNLGAKLKKLGDKAFKTGEDIDKKLGSLSDAAKKAIENAKSKAGQKWDEIKDVYINAVSSIDNAITASKDTISDMAEKFKIKKDELETTVANVCANALTSGKEIANKLSEWTADATKYPTQIAACTALITGAKLATSAGFNSSMIIDLLASAGIK